MTNKQVLRVGIGGPVGSGKTALVNVLCKQMRGKYQIAVVTNDIYTKNQKIWLASEWGSPSISFLEYLQ